VGFAEEFERRLEQIVEGFFSKAFRSKVQPAEIGRRLVREMEAGKSVSVGAVYVPNIYVIRLSPDDHGRLEGLLPKLGSEFAQMLESAARERRWRLPGRISVQFLSDEKLSEDRFEIEGSHRAEEEKAAGKAPPSALRLLNSDASQSWELTSEEVVIGRQENCDIVIPDPSASRRHASMQKRSDGWWIVDLEATNGTLVNGTLVKERRLRPGDRIGIGSAELEYREGAESTKG
jgi:hypothetical protein